MMRTRLAIALGSFAAFNLTLGMAAVAAQAVNLTDPADPGVAVPVIKHESAFADYQPFREQKIRSWKEVNQEVADNPGMGAMGSMKDTGSKPMVGMDSKAGDAAKSKDSAAGHNMGAMKDMPDVNKEAASSPNRKEGHSAMAMATPQTAPGEPENARTGGVTGTGVVQGIDKANGKIKLTHDPIAALGWPKMTMYFRLKDGALAEQVKEGDKVEFSLEKSGAGYVISGFQKGPPGHAIKQLK